MKLNDKINKILHSKKIIPVLLTTMLCGIVLMLFSDSTFEQQKKEESTQIAESLPSDFDSSYDNLETKIENILSEISGVGEAEVLVVYKSTDTKEVLKDSSEEGDGRTVIVSGDSGETPYVLRTNYPEISGVLVVAQGGDDKKLKIELAETISDILSIPIHKVKIMGRKN